MMKWAIELSEYDIEYRARTAAKAQVLTDFISELPVESVILEGTSSPKWLLYVDGSATSDGSGIGIRLESPTGEILEQSFRLNFPATNNEAEYEALIAGLRLAKQLQVTDIHAHCDSQLVASSG